MNATNFTGFYARAAGRLLPYSAVAKEMMANSEAIGILEPVTWLVAALVVGRTVMNLLRWRRKLRKKDVIVTATAVPNSELDQFLMEVQ